MLVKQQKDAREYGSPKDNKEAAALLSELHSKFNESEKMILNILVENLSNIIKVKTTVLFASLFISFAVPHMCTRRIQSHIMIDFHYLCT